MSAFSSHVVTHTFYFVDSYYLIPGYGIFTIKPIQKDDFIAEYRGELMSRKDGDEKEEEYGEKYGSYLYFFDDYW